MQRHAVDQPFRTYSQPLRLSGPDEDPFSALLLHGGRTKAPSLWKFPRFQALNAPPWRVITLDTGHWPMLMPAALADILDGIAATI